MKMQLWTVAAIFALPVASAAEPKIPIFDAHVHYSHDAWESTPPKAAIAILRKAGLKRAMVSSSSDEGTQKLYAEAPDLIVPSLRPYRKRGEISSWVRDESIIPPPRSAAEAVSLRGDRRVSCLRQRCRPAGGTAHSATGEAAQALAAPAWRQ